MHATDSENNLRPNKRQIEKVDDTPGGEGDRGPAAGDTIKE